MFDFLPVARTVGKDTVPLSFREVLASSFGGTTYGLRLGLG
jgi:hypothetical protein